MKEKNLLLNLNNAPKSTPYLTPFEVQNLNGCVGPKKRSDIVLLTKKTFDLLSGKKKIHSDGFCLTQNAFVETAIYQLLRGNAFLGMTASQIRNSMYHRKCKYVQYSSVQQIHKYIG